MVEIRNDEIADAAGQAKWAELLAGILGRIPLPSEHAGGPHADTAPKRHTAS